MKILHNLVQGSEEWKAVRLSHFTASEAPVMMGASPHMSRDDLLAYKATQNEKEVSYWTQKIYDKGHEVEALARPIAESILGEELYPVTGCLEVEDLPLLASFDGLNMMETINWEHKQWNATKAAKIAETGELGEEYFWQVEHQLLVSGAEKTMFTMSDGTEENKVFRLYRSVPERRAQLIAGWKQFQKDLENYVPKVYEEMPEPEAIMDLPALSIQLVGQVKESNLAVYQKTAMEFIAAINTDLQTDQDFANAEKMVKFCDKTEKELEMVKKQALSQTADIDLLFRTVDTLKESMRAKRLELNKLVTQKKELIRNQIMQRGAQEFADEVKQANDEIMPIMIPAFKADFAGAMKGKKTIKSLNESVNDELAKAKIEINSVKDHILLNLKAYNNLAGNHQFLFNDLQQIIMKDSVDFTLLVETRIERHEQAEKEKLEAERQRIQAEEEAKAKAKIEAEARELATQQHLKDQAEILEASRLEAEKIAQPEATMITRHEPALSRILDAEEAKSAPKANSPEQDIVNYLYNEFGIYSNQATLVANAIIQGRMPHTSYTGRDSKAA